VCRTLILSEILASVTKTIKCMTLSLRSGWKRHARARPRTKGRVSSTQQINSQPWQRRWWNATRTGKGHTASRRPAGVRGPRGGRRTPENRYRPPRPCALLVSLSRCTSFIRPRPPPPPPPLICAAVRGEGWLWAHDGGRGCVRPCCTCI